MQVNPASSLKVLRHVPAPQQPDHDKKDVHDARTKNSRALQEELTPDVSAAPDDSADDKKTRGVIRLLEEGHFRGVADVRLRINNHEELLARAGAEAGRVVTDHAGNLLESVNTQRTTSRPSTIRPPLCRTSGMSSPSCSATGRAAG